MTLLVLSYHRARPGRDGNAADMLDAHFRHIAANYENVLPGERLLVSKDSVCVSFDGAFYDFRAKVFPLLRKHNLRALLAVAPALINDQCMATGDDRIAIASEVAYSGSANEAFCTWRELDEMLSSGHVAIAAHGYTHRSLDRMDADAEAEVHVPRTLLGARLNTTVESFVFPHGRYTSHFLEEAKSGYDFVFARGNASNRKWRTRVIYRINGDNLRSPHAPFTPACRLRHRVRYFWNTLRRA